MNRARPMKLRNVMLLCNAGTTTLEQARPIRGESVPVACLNLQRKQR